MTGGFSEWNSFGETKLTKMKFKGEKKLKSVLGKHGGNINITGFGVDLDDMFVVGGI
jgi:hypothetical protein